MQEPCLFSLQTVFSNTQPFHIASMNDLQHSPKTRENAKLFRLLVDLKNAFRLA